MGMVLKIYFTIKTGTIPRALFLRSQPRLFVLLVFNVYLNKDTMLLFVPEALFFSLLFCVFFFPMQITILNSASPLLQLCWMLGVWPRLNSPLTSQTEDKKLQNLTE